MSRFSFDSFRPMGFAQKIRDGHRSCEKIAFTTCKMSNVCCAMFNVGVKTPDDLLTKPPNPQWDTIYSSGHFVSESFYKFIGHRTTDLRHLTALAVVDFFTVPMTAATAQRRATGSR